MIEQLYESFLKSSGVCTDTRQLVEGNIFFALKGPNFDGNKYAASALESGASLAVIDDPEYQISGKTFLAEDCLSTLQQLASYHRDQLQIPIVGITGSNGKTTTKELVNAVLSSRYRTFATQGNLNNHIGVPLSILSITKETELAVIEMGANHIGEISQLCQIAKPTHGIITNIGKAHTGLFGGFEGVIRAKSELYDFLIKNGGQVFINENQEILKNMAKRFKEPIFYPEENSYYHCEFLSADPFVHIKTESGSLIKTNLLGKYNFDNIATALCVGKFFNVDEYLAHKAVSDYKPNNNRSQVIKKDSNTIILDAYNANPSSMEKALENFRSMTAKKKAVILGDMFELGDDSDKEHQQIGKILEKMALQNIFLCGKAMKNAHLSCPGSHYFETKDQLIEFIQEHKLTDFTILIKASRGMSLEVLLEYL